MSFSLFLRGLVGVLLVFAVTTYLITGSLWSTFIQTVICAVLVQIGYFAAVLFLVWRSGAARKDEVSMPKSEAAQGLATDEEPAAEVGQPARRAALGPSLGPTPWLEIASRTCEQSIVSSRRSCCFGSSAANRIDGVRSERHHARSLCHHRCQGCGSNHTARGSVGPA